MPVAEETWLAAIEPLRLPSGEVLWFDTPSVSWFYLLAARARRDEAEPKRQRTLAHRRKAPDGDYRPVDQGAAFDALEAAAQAVILSIAAIEAFANQAIDHLSEDTTVSVRRPGGRVEIRRDSMIRRLSISEKLKLAVPLHTGRSSVAATSVWPMFVRLKLRDDLVHVKEDYSTNPDEPSPFGRLLRGDAARAPEDAAAVIHALDPTWIPERIRADFGLQ